MAFFDDVAEKLKKKHFLHATWSLLTVLAGALWYMTVSMFSQSARIDVLQSKLEALEDWQEKLDRGEIVGTSLRLTNRSGNRAEVLISTAGDEPFIELRDSKGGRRAFIGRNELGEIPDNRRHWGLFACDSTQRYVCAIGVDEPTQPNGDYEAAGLSLYHRVSPRHTALRAALETQAGGDVALQFFDELGAIRLRSGFGIDTHAVPYLDFFGTEDVDSEGKFVHHHALRIGFENEQESQEARAKLLFKAPWVAADGGNKTLLNGELTMGPDGQLGIRHHE